MIEQIKIPWVELRPVWWIIIFWIIVDQITKNFIHSTFALHESVTIITNYFNLTYIQNYGAAFGFLANSNPILRGIILYSMPPLAVLIILIMIVTDNSKRKLEVFALSSIAGGALGNYIDRIRLGFVVDFLDFHINRTLSWPAFNFADAAIVCGVFTLLIFMIRNPKVEVSSNE